jgi:hypothetical protein
MTSLTTAKLVTLRTSVAHTVAAIEHMSIEHMYVAAIEHMPDTARK